MNSLDPSSFLSKLSCCFQSNEEVEVRRCISILYFSVFNFWMEKAQIKMGKSKNFVNMFRSLRGYQLETGNKVPIPDLNVLDRYRVAADHYFGNNVMIHLESGEFYVNFDIHTQEQVKQATNIVLSFLRKTSRLRDLD